MGILRSAVELLPTLLLAVIIFVVGIYIARGLGGVVSKLLTRVYLDQASDRTVLKKGLERIGFKMSLSQALGLLTTWFLYAVVLVATADVLGLAQISQFLGAVVLYIPNVIIAVVILIVGLIIGNFVHTLVKETTAAAELAAGHMLAMAAKWAILVFTFMAALVQLRVASQLIQILFTGLVFMIALAGGIAFGLGGKDKAKDLLDQLSKK